MTFEELSLTITNLSKNPNLDFFVVGQSTLGQPIYGVHLGSYEGKQILIEGGIHAREYPSTLVVVKMIEYMTTQNFETGGVYVIPLSNPDGARIVLDGTDWIKCEKLRNYILDINSYFNKINTLKEEYRNKINVLCGIEIGLQPNLKEAIQNNINGYDFDFIIGSSHAVNNVDIGYNPDKYFGGKSEKEAYREYFESILENVKTFNNYSVYGHLDYVVRYGPNKNKHFDFNDYKNVFEEILKTIIPEL